MVPTATPHVLSHPSSWLLSSVKVMDGLCSAALGTEKALPPFGVGNAGVPNHVLLSPWWFAVTASTEVVLLMLQPWIRSR